MTTTERYINDFCTIMIGSLEKNEPLDYKGTIGLLKHILILVEKPEISILPPPYGKPVLARFTDIPQPQVVYREKNATNDYYVVCYWGFALKAEDMVDWKEIN